MEGLDNTQIASRLGITERTVRAHVSSVLERTGRGQPHTGRGGRDPARLGGDAVLALLLALAHERRCRCRDPQIRARCAPHCRARCAPRAGPRAPGSTTAAPAAPCSSGARRSRGCRPPCRSWSRPPQRSTGSARGRPLRDRGARRRRRGGRRARGEPVPARLGRPHVRHECAQHGSPAWSPTPASSGSAAASSGTRASSTAAAAAPPAASGSRPMSARCRRWRSTTAPLLSDRRAGGSATRPRSRPSGCAYRCAARTSPSRGRCAPASPRPTRTTVARRGVPAARTASCATRTRCRTTTTPRCC